MNKIRNLTFGSIIVASITIVFLASSLYPSVITDVSTISENTKMETEMAPEVFDVIPTITNLNPSELVLETSETKIIPIVTEISSDSAANFILPLFEQASALSPNQNTATFTEWTVPTANAGVRSPQYDATTNSIWFSEASHAFHMRQCTTSTNLRVT